MKEHGHQHTKERILPPCTRKGSLGLLLKGEETGRGTEVDDEGDGRGLSGDSVLVEYVGWLLLSVSRHKSSKGLCCSQMLPVWNLFYFILFFTEVEALKHRNSIYSNLAQDPENIITE